MNIYLRRRVAVGVILLLVVVAAIWGCERRTQVTSATGSSPAAVSASGAPSPLTPTEQLARENARPGTANWTIPEGQTAALTELAGYTGASSVPVGGTVALHVRSTLGPVTVTAVRIGHYGGVGGRAVWTSPATTVAAQPDPKVLDGGMVVAGWSPALTVETKDWPDGAYVLILRAGGKGAYVPLTVRPASLKGRLVLVNPTATWQAYNEFGGYSLYKGPGGKAHATRVSFERPYANNAQHFFLDEYPYVRLAESKGLPMGYITSEDLETPGILEGARGIVSGGHDEYWTVPMRDAVEAARDKGVNIAFLGGNELYWRVRFDSDHRVVIGYRDAFGSDPVKGPTTTALWRSNPHPRPENTLTGQMYECYPTSGDWVVTTPDWFGYAGTGVRAGSRFAGVVGVESNRAYPVAGTPSTLQVVAYAKVSCGQGHSAHTGTYYTAPSGAGVFAVGTINWANVVGDAAGDDATRAFVKAVTGNVLTAMAEGPMGAKHPATPNIGSFDLPKTTGNGTGGPAVFPAP